MGIKQLATAAEFASAKASEKLAVVDFFATWCGPCRMVAPKVEELSQHSDVASAGVTFYKVDVDKLPEVASSEMITGMPTFKGYKEGQDVFTVIGANIQELTDKVTRNF